MNGTMMKMASELLLLIQFLKLKFQLFTREKSPSHTMRRAMMAKDSMVPTSVMINMVMIATVAIIMEIITTVTTAMATTTTAILSMVNTTMAKNSYLITTSA